MHHAANSLASRAANPTQNDSKRLIQCLGYISQSIEQKMDYIRERRTVQEETFLVETFSDASYAPGSDIKLVSGMAMYMNVKFVNASSSIRLGR